jgi:hypothetical protein
MCKESARKRWVGALCCIVLLAGCDRRDIRVYQIAKEPSPWKLPAGWQEQEPGGMSAASFVVEGKDGKIAEISVVPFKGVVGQDVDLVNVVRDRFGLPPLSAEELSKQVERVDVGPIKGKLFEMAAGTQGSGGGEPTRFVIATVARENTSWFFRMSGQDSLVREQKTAFVAFLKSFAFMERPASQGRARQASTNAKQMPKSVAGNAPNWTIPDHWQEQPATAMRLGSFLITGQGGGKADVSVTMFPGDAGGTLANINRWRTQQLNLPAVQEADLAKLMSPLELPTGAALLTDMTTDNKQTRLVAAIVPREGNTWFFKMMGDEAVVGAEKASLIEFVRSMK